MFDMVLLTIVTLGLYLIYWTVTTKRDLVAEGARIPTSLLMFIPLANLYYWYRFAEGFSKIVMRDEKLTIVYFLLLAFLFPAGTLVCQSYINDDLDRKLRFQAQQ